MNPVYLDYNATTPLDPEVREAMLPVLDGVWGNPSSVHEIGRKARACLDECRERAAQVLGCKPSEVIFTSGGTESNNLAIFGAARSLKSKGNHLITSPIEHHAVLHCFERLEREEGFSVTHLPVDQDGRVAVDSLREALRPETVLVSIMAANNEIGTIQPIAELGALCRERGVVFHTDAVQWFAKEPFDSVHQFHADLVSVCAHKFHGPKGVGALYSNSPQQLSPLLLGGAHENERRAGTENLAGIVGFVSALERFVQTPVFDQSTIEPLTQRIRAAAANQAGVIILSPESGCLANTLALLVEQTDSITLLANLDLEGFCASSGSACTAGSVEPSHVVTALGHPKRLANSLVRFSLGRENTPEDITSLVEKLPEIIACSTRSR